MAFTLRKKKKQPEFGKSELLALAALLAIALAGVLIGVLAEGGESDDVSSGRASDEPLATPDSQDAAANTAPEPTEDETDTSDAQPVILTVDNNQDLASLLSGAEDYALSSGFSEEYAGETIEFDANVAYVAPHGEYETRYDFLVYAGDYSETEANPGPAFQFRDENFNDLGVTDPAATSVSVGDNVTVTAIVGEFNAQQGVFLLDPVSTEPR